MKLNNESILNNVDKIVFLLRCYYNKEEISKKKRLRDQLIVNHKKEIKYWGYVYDVPPELIAGVLFNECPRIDDNIDKYSFDVLAELAYDLGIKETDVTIGPAQASETSARKELINILSADEKVLIENLSREDLQNLLYTTSFAIRYIAMVLGKVKKQKYPNMASRDLTEDQMANIIRQWNKNKGDIIKLSYSSAFKVMLPYIRALLSD